MSINKLVVEGNLQQWRTLTGPAAVETRHIISTSRNAVIQELFQRRNTYAVIDKFLQGKATRS